MGVRLVLPPAAHPPSETRKFGYLSDWTFLAACLLYTLNRFWSKPHLGEAFPFLRNHFDDCLLIPAALPPLLLVFRKLGLRSHDAPPTLREVAEWTLLWSLTFEWAFPRFLHKGVADWRDALAYAAGALVSWCLWHCTYTPSNQS